MFGNNEYSITYDGVLLSDSKPNMPVPARVGLDGGDIAALISDSRSTSGIWRGDSGAKSDGNLRDAMQPNIKGV